MIAETLSGLPTEILGHYFGKIADFVGAELSSDLDWKVWKIEHGFAANNSDFPERYAEALVALREAGKPKPLLKFYTQEAIFSIVHANWYGETDAAKFGKDFTFLAQRLTLDQQIAGFSAPDEIAFFLKTFGTVVNRNSTAFEAKVWQILLEILRLVQPQTDRFQPAAHGKIFIFHNTADRKWVETHLVPRLEQAGLPVQVAFQTYEKSDFEALKQTLAECKAALIVCSGKFSPNEKWLLEGTVDAEFRKMLALRLDESPVPPGFFAQLDLDSGDDSADHFRPLLALLLPEGGIPDWPLLDEQFINIGAMPNIGARLNLFGRGRELQLLDDVWARRDCRVLAFVAQGGTGKSALFNRWLQDMRRDYFRGAGRVLAHSFYSQGAGERVTSADLFIDSALSWFGERDFEQRSPWDKGKRLAQLVSEHRTLLVLDGLEPLQEGGPVDTGKVKDPALFTLIRDLAKRNEGLCIITSRLHLGGLERQAAGIRQVELDQVSDEAGRKILQFPGDSDDKFKVMVQGDDAKIEQVVRDFGNHAFALGLLRQWLYAQPGHRIEMADTIPDLPGAPLEKGRHARRVIAAFEKLMREKGLDDEVRLLRFLGLFDRPVGREAIKLLHPFADFTDALMTLSQYKLVYLEKQDKLLQAGKDRLVDCHPLVREHYGEVLKAEEPELWVKSHAALYRYYEALPEQMYGKFLPNTMEEIEPLFLAIRHGCMAGFHQKVSDELYWKRILRKSDFFLKEQLGAWATDLALLSNFFERTWQAPVKNLSEEDRALVLSWAGYDLTTVGHLQKAMEPIKASITLHEKLGNWDEIALNYSNLADLSSLSGNLKNAAMFAKTGVEYADKSGDWTYRMRLRTTYANVLFSKSQDEEALRFFKEAEEILRENPPNSQYLYSVGGYNFCDFLLEYGKCLEVLGRVEKTIEVAKKNFGIIDFALDCLSIGRAFTMMALDNPSEETITAANAYLSEAVESLRKSGQQNNLPLGLLARAAFMTIGGEFSQAEADLEEVLDIAEPSGMRLHLCDYHLETARLRLAQGRPDDARPHVDEAARLIEETGYHRRDKELEELKGGTGLA